MTNCILICSGLGIFLTGSTVSIALCCCGKYCYKKTRKCCCPENKVNDINTQCKEKLSTVVVPYYVQQPDKIYSLGIQTIRMI